MKIRQIQGQIANQITAPVDFGREYQVFKQVTMHLSGKHIKNSKSQNV